ncbi:MAG: iron ABC transporter permease [Proteobacteria bacterium]|nr:iron ABC transporter permease [Pseudomonadota bacterium]
MQAPLTPARCAAIVLVAAGVAAVVLLASLAIGSVTVDFTTVLRALTGADTTSEGAAIVRSLRAPRALSAFAVGGLLALAGALLQVLLRNPLADPYVLGVSGGAAVGALGALLLGAGALLGPAAFAGALLSTLLVFALAHDTGRPPQPTRLLLTGIVLASGWGAVVALLLTLAPMAQVKGMLYWLLGDLSGAAHPWPALAALAVAIVVAGVAGRALNVLVHGADAAATLGVNVTRLALATHALAAFCAAVAVAVAGSVGFVGLVVPHAVRLVIGNDQRALLPTAALAGGALLALADALARTLFVPHELPVGVLTVLLGVPAFLLLQRTAR